MINTLWKGLGLLLAQGLTCPPGLLDFPKALHILVIFKHLQGQSLLYCSTITKKKDASLRLGIGILKFSFSEKATKMCAIILMVLKFT